MGSTCRWSLRGAYVYSIWCVLQNFYLHISVSKQPSVNQSPPYGWSGDEVSMQFIFLWSESVWVSWRGEDPIKPLKHQSIVTCIMIPWKMTAYSHRLNSQFTKYERLGNTVSSNWCKSTDRRKPWHRVEVLQMENKEQNTQFHTGLTKPIHLFMFLLSFVKPSRSLTFSFRNNYIKLNHARLLWRLVKLYFQFQLSSFSSLL